jgi:hypothetical protein
MWSISVGAVLSLQSLVSAEIYIRRESRSIIISRIILKKFCLSFQLTVLDKYGANN